MEKPRAKMPTIKVGEINHEMVSNSIPKFKSKITFKEDMIKLNLTRNT